MDVGTAMAMSVYGSPYGVTTSSTTRMSGSRCAATENASRMYMPLE